MGELEGYMESKLNIVVSIIVPVYKVELYLALCIDSLLQQTYSDLQIILVDDGSPDQSPYICDTYMKKDKRIQVIHKENAGVAAARNTGLNAARGKYILFIDADDMILPSACADLVRRAERYSADVVMGNYYWVDENGKAMGDSGSVQLHKDVDGILSGQEYLLNSLQDKTYSCIVCKNLYQRRFLLEHNLYFIPGILCEDEEWMPRVLKAAQRIIEFVPPFYQYRMRPDSAMHDDQMAVERQLSFIKNVAPAVSTFFCQEDPVLHKLLMHDLLRVFLTDLAMHWRYFATHKDDLQLSFWKNYAFDSNSKFWLNLLSVQVCLFVCVWQVRAYLKKMLNI